MEDCPICYEIMTDINVCTTICKHKFHTNCLMRCGNVCPICRTNVISSSNRHVSTIPAGIYNSSEYIQQLNQHNISMHDISDTINQWLEDCEEHEEIIKEIEEKKIQREEEYKNNLKHTDINKYKLFYK